MSVSLGDLLCSIEKLMRTKINEKQLASYVRKS